MAAVAAVAIVCKTPRPGASKTRLQPRLGPGDAAALSACFIRDVAAAVDAVPAATGRRAYAIYAPAGSEAALRPLLPAGPPSSASPPNSAAERRPGTPDRRTRRPVRSCLPVETLRPTRKMGFGSGKRAMERSDSRWGALMAEAQAGDARAYDTLLREILPFLRAVCRRRLGPSAEVEEAVQDALLTIHRLRHTYDPARPLQPWLAVIADRRAVDRLRRHGRRAKHETALEPSTETLAVAPAKEWENSGEEALAADQLRDAVAGLPESQRQALTLTKLQGLSLAEASARSGLSVGALKVATHRALRTLRTRLGTGR
jgi:RNA polymerase sigma-70 factor (ECF subfamily)